MSFSEWVIRPVGYYNQDGRTEDRGLYEVYRTERGGVFNSKEEAEHLAYELNKEAHGELDK